MQETAKAKVDAQIVKEANKTIPNQQEMFNTFNKRPQTYIRAVFKGDTSEIATVQEDIEQQTVNYWTSIMNQQVDKQHTDYERHRQTILASVERSDAIGALTGNLTAQQLTDATKAMTCNGPGPDCINLRLYTLVPELLDEIAVVWQNRLRFGLPAQWHNSYIQLIHKKGDTKRASNYRPIALQCVALKIITKALQIQIDKLLPQFIRTEQRAFVHGRSIHDALATILATSAEAADERLQGYDTKYAMFQMDFTKAYDKLDRDYLFDIMAKKGFNPNLINDLKLIYTNSTSQIKVNGRLTEKFDQTVGVRQGDSLSVLLYVIAMDAYFSTAEKIGFKGFAPKTATTPTNVLGVQYVDDTTAFVQSRQDIDKLTELNEMFAIVSGQENKISETTIRIGTGFTQSDLPLFYRNQVMKECQTKKVLGFHLNHKGLLDVKATWNDAIDSVRGKVNRWLAFQKYGRSELALMVNSHILAKPNYLSALLPMPDSIVKKLRTLIYEKLLNRGIFVHPKTEHFAQSIEAAGLTKRGIGLILHNSQARLVMSAVKWLNLKSNLRNKTDEYYWQAARDDSIQMWGVPATLNTAIPWKVACKATDKNPRLWAFAALAQLDIQIEGNDHPHPSTIKDFHIFGNRDLNPNLLKSAKMDHRTVTLDDAWTKRFANSYPSNVTTIIDSPRARQWKQQADNMNTGDFAIDDIVAQYEMQHGKHSRTMIGVVIPRPRSIPLTNKEVAVKQLDIGIGDQIDLLPAITKAHNTKSPTVLPIDTLRLCYVDSNNILKPCIEKRNDRHLAYIPLTADVATEAIAHQINSDIFGQPLPVPANAIAVAQPPVAPVLDRKLITTEAQKIKSRVLRRKYISDPRYTSKLPQSVQNLVRDKTRLIKFTALDVRLVRKRLEQMEFQYPPPDYQTPLKYKDIVRHNLLSMIDRDYWWLYNHNKLQFNVPKCPFCDKTEQEVNTKNHFVHECSTVNNSKNTIIAWLLLHTSSLTHRFRLRCGFDTQLPTSLFDWSDPYQAAVFVIITMIRRVAYNLVIANKVNHNNAPILVETLLKSQMTVIIGKLEYEVNKQQNDEQAPDTDTQNNTWFQLFDYDGLKRSVPEDVDIAEIYSQQQTMDDSTIVTIDWPLLSRSKALTEAPAQSSPQSLTMAIQPNKVQQPTLMADYDTDEDFEDKR
jgi:hypothetical protein